ncbi:MAG: hypothetical protein F6K26_56845 [Moorea sp. SIO2I5]|nr:hypothetical protein [Moorena sp. SIO2I5]
MANGQSHQLPIGAKLMVGSAQQRALSADLTLYQALPTLHQLKSIWGYTILSYLFPVPCSLFPVP